MNRQLRQPPRIMNLLFSPKISFPRYPWQTKKSLFFCLIITVAFLSLARTNIFAADADSLIRQVEDNLTGKTAFQKIALKMKTPRTERTMAMESYSIGKKKSFIRITYPQKDKGITFLKIDSAMWQYVPRIEKTLKIPASMMLQSWMGTDFTNDDLVRESSISEDYKATLLSENDTDYEIELLPLEDAPVVWGKIIMTVSKTYLLPLSVKYYDEEGELVRILSYQDIKKFGKRYFPALWVMEPQDKEKAGHQTIITILESEFDEKIDNAYFTKRALKRFSR
ncbi:MAG: outer membrane lipoprotein-sorting protein [Desulfobulbaceae bacterium]|nr:outer membrane lipoprotein-sorting protein [Desulfobulbaceae bacterium]